MPAVPAYQYRDFGKQETCKPVTYKRLHSPGLRAAEVEGLPVALLLVELYLGLSGFCLHLRFDCISASAAHLFLLRTVVPCSYVKLGSFSVLMHMLLPGELAAGCELLTKLYSSEHAD